MLDHRLRAPSGWAIRGRPRRRLNIGFALYMRFGDLATCIERPPGRRRGRWSFLCGCGLSPGIYWSLEGREWSNRGFVSCGFGDIDTFELGSEGGYWLLEYLDEQLQDMFKHNSYIRWRRNLDHLHLPPSGSLDVARGMIMGPMSSGIGRSYRSGPWPQVHGHNRGANRLYACPCDYIIPSVSADWMIMWEAEVNAESQEKRSAS